jgi:dipeptidase E
VPEYRRLAIKGGMYFFTVVSEEEMVFVRKSLDELLGFGIKNDHITRFDPDDSSTYRDKAQVDCIYVCGGNTFYLLNKLKESGYFARTVEWVNDGMLYVGVSAGSVIASPDIEYISCIDENDIGISDTAAFSFVPASIIPHYADEFADAVNKLRATGTEVVTIGNSEALAVDGDKVEKINPGR